MTTSRIKIVAQSYRIKKTEEGWLIQFPHHQGNLGLEWHKLSWVSADLEEKEVTRICSKKLPGLKKVKE